MAITTIYTYQLNGTQRDFNIPFEYLARRFVVLTLIGTNRKELVLTSDYRFVSQTVVSTNVAWGPAEGYERLEVRRSTSATDRLVGFADGSILRASELNISQIQTLHVAEEARNMVADTIGENEEGQLDARGRRILNLADAVDSRDAITLGQVLRQSANAFESAAKAAASEANAKASESIAKGAETKARTSEVNAKDSEERTLQHRTAAEAASAASKTSADQSSSSAAAALTHRDSAGQSASAAAESKSEAQQAASRANADAATVLAHIASYGANPVGTVVIGIKETLPGHLILNGSTFSTQEYPELAAYLGTNVLPDWRGRYIKGAVTGQAGAFGAGVVPLHTHAVAGHSHTATVSSDTHSHTVTGSTGAAGAHNHSYTDPLIGTDSITVGSGSGVTKYRVAANAGGTGWVGDHAHSVTGSTSSHSHSHSVTLSAVPASTTGGFGAGEKVETDRVHVNFFIKAKGLAQA